MWRSPASASGLGPGGRRFESFHPDKVLKTSISAKSEHIKFAFFVFTIPIKKIIVSLPRIIFYGVQFLIVTMNKQHNAKIKFLKKHWRELAGDVFKATIATFGVIITFSDALLNVIPDETILYRWLYQLVHLPFDKPIFILLLVLIIAIIATIFNWPKTRAVYKDPHSDLRVIVECCDLFDQEGLKVIHAVDTFDTELGRIISPNSVHGLFLQRAQKANIDIDSIIETRLQDTSPASIDEDLPGKKVRYTLGTVCAVDIEDDNYALVSFTHLKKNGTISIQRNEYTQFMLDMWRNLSSPFVRQDTINVAVMGNRFVDLPADFSTEQKIDLMIQTFFAIAKEKTCCKTMRICVHESNIAEVDFPHYELIISHLARRPII